MIDRFTRSLAVDGRLFHEDIAGSRAYARALVGAGVPVWPASAPRAGHMGILPSAVGPEPIVRLQTGGLKAGQVLARGLDAATAEDLAFIQLL